jgi:hypothetical protein
MPDNETHATAQAIFRALNIAVHPTSFRCSVALDKLRRERNFSSGLGGERWVKNIGPSTLALLLR